MATLPVFNLNKEEVGKIELDDDVWGVAPCESLVWSVVVAYNANQRQGTACTKNRKYVSGGGAKPFRQKGTGRARQGTSRSPVKKGGGVVFGPNPRDFSKKINRKAKNKALRSVLSHRLKGAKVVVVDSLDFDAFKTKRVVEVLKKFELESALFVGAAENKKLYFSTRNLQKTNYLTYADLNVHEVLISRNLLLSKESIGKLTERLREKKND